MTDTKTAPEVRRERLDARYAAAAPTEPAPPPEVREHAKVTAVDWKHGRVTLELQLPIELDELPSVDDEVEVAWPGKWVGE